jgi:hypothetical protein
MQLEYQRICNEAAVVYADMSLKHLSRRPQSAVQTRELVIERCFVFFLFKLSILHCILVELDAVIRQS